MISLCHFIVHCMISALTTCNNVVPKNNRFVAQPEQYQTTGAYHDI